MTDNVDSPGDDSVSDSHAADEPVNNGDPEPDEAEPVDPADLPEDTP